MEYGNHYLKHGLDILACAHELDYFADGHRGAAIIAGYYFLQENPQLIEAHKLFAKQVNGLWIDSEKYSPIREENSNTALLSQITTTLANNLSGLRQAGHNVILPSLALKAFHERPNLITPRRVNGICKLIESFTIQSTKSSEPILDFPPINDHTALAEFILQEFISCTQRFIGRGQGWSGHLLTYGMALIDLQQLGYTDLVKNAKNGFLRYINRIRQGPLEVDIPRKEHIPLDYYPTEDAYWHDKVGDWRLGHILKYPYGFFGLLKHIDNENLQEQCVSSSFHIF